MGSRVDITVEVDLGDIDDVDLIAEIKRRNMPPPYDEAEIETARDEIMRGRRDEALIHIERALGGDFVGRLAI